MEQSKSIRTAAAWIGGKGNHSVHNGWVDGDRA